MSVTIVKGSTFSSTVTAGGLHALVESATISAISRDNMKSDSTVATLSATPQAAPLDNELWQDTNSLFLSSYDEANVCWVPGVSVGEAYTLSAFALAVSAGSLLFASNQCVAGALTLSDYSARASDYVVGVATAAVSPGSKGVAITKGPAKVISTGVITAGMAVKPSSGGVAESAGAAGSGYGGFSFGVALEVAASSKVWISLKR